MTGVRAPPPLTNTCSTGPGTAILFRAFFFVCDTEQIAVAVPLHDTSSLRESDMSLGTILLIVLVLALLGVIPTWPHSRQWGYAPSGVVGVILVVILILFLLGRI